LVAARKLARAFREQTRVKDVLPLNSRGAEKVEEELKYHGWLC